MYSNQNCNGDQYKHDPTANPIENAINQMNYQFPLPEAMAIQTRTCMKTVQINKGDLLLMPDMQVTKMYYLNKGLLKLSCDQIDGTRKPLDFWDAGEYVLMSSEFLLGKKNEKFYIEALEDAELVVILKEEFRTVLDVFWETHPLLKNISDLKSRRRICHLQLLMLPPNKRYAALGARGCLYQNMRLKTRLADQEMAEFLAISLRTLYLTKKN